MIMMMANEWTTTTTIFFWLTTTSMIIRADPACDPRLPHCRGQGAQGPRRQDCKPLYLIPGKAVDCTKPSSKRLLNVDANSVSISPNPIKLPGCFTITMTAQINEINQGRSFFGKTEFHFQNLPQLSEMRCQNASANGCGGYGNNCYYCDLCNNLQQLDQSSSSSGTVNQFKGLKCPDKPGRYQFQRQFCFNDWSEVDKDNDCKIDALENGQLGDNYADVLKKISQTGGTVVGKFTLAYNSTSQQYAMKQQKEAAMRQAVSAQVETKRADWGLKQQEYNTFKAWYVQNRVDTWNKEKYLPWLMYNNECGCLTVNFDVCSEKPVPATSGPNSYQCG